MCSPINLTGTTYMLEVKHILKSFSGLGSECSAPSRIKTKGTTCIPSLVGYLVTQKEAFSVDMQYSLFIRKPRIRSFIQQIINQECLMSGSQYGLVIGTGNRKPGSLCSISSSDTDSLCHFDQVTEHLFASPSLKYKVTLTYFTSRVLCSCRSF